ncbi:MAG: 30S ribosomal protein S9 [Nanoarchaeota archaeon]|nr:30S ribosomal protein S9 [Nanoarchaeota archaeon]
MKTIHVSGKRKKAIARATLKKGKGNVRINSLLLDAYTPKMAKLMIMEPLVIAGDITKKMDINISVKGGGWHSQAEAVRLVLGKALAEYDPKSLRKALLDYDRHLIVSDVRRTEPSKPNDSKPRAKRQKSYR